MAETKPTGAVLTLADKHRLESELSMLKTVRRAEVTREISEARAHGDLSENAEYDEAKNEEARVQARIMELEELLANATIVDEDDSTADTVSFGTIVGVYDMEYDEDVEYTIVGFTESDPSRLFISGESPIGAALMGAKVGDIVEAETPGGIVKMQVKSIKRR